jgi:hypothetical protein
MYNMEDLEIGEAEINYSPSGDVTIAVFTPTMRFVADSDLLGTLRTINRSDEEGIKTSAEIIFSSWFSKMNDIELADRDIFSIVSSVVRCEKWPDGSVKKCVVRFDFQKTITQVLN